MKSQISIRTEQDFARSFFCFRYAHDANTNQIASAAQETWRDINIILMPIIGRRGVIALIKRSVHLQQAKYKLLDEIQVARICPEKFSALHTILIKQNHANADLISSALLNCFYDLLINFIGAPLAHQLFHAVDTSGNSIRRRLNYH